MNAAYQSAAHNAADHRPGNASQSRQGFHLAHRAPLRLEPVHAEHFAALIRSCLLATDQYQINFAQIDSIIAQARQEASGIREPISDESALAALDLFSQRTLNLLELHGFHFVRDLRTLTEARIRSWSNAGSMVVREIRGVLEKIEAELRGR